MTFYLKERMSIFMMSTAPANVNGFLTFSRNLGYVISDFIADGKIHRFKHGRRENGWYVGFLNHSQRLKRDFLVVEFGDWVTGEKHHYHDDLTHVEKSEVEKIRKEMAEKRAEMVREKLDLQEKVAQEAEQFWDRCVPFGDHGYLQRKHLGGLFGARINEKLGELIVPTTQGGRIYGYQAIKADGKKIFKAGQRFKGTYFSIGTFVDDTGPIYLCEGFATGASIHMATGRPVVVAFSSGNLAPVAAQFEGYRLVVAGDNDAYNGHNAGEAAAKNLNKKYGLPYILPQFKDLKSNPTDFNDLHCLEGLGAVKEQLMGTGSSPDKKKSKVTSGLLYRELSQIINRRKPDNPIFPDVYLVIESEPGLRQVIQIVERRVARYVDPKAVANSLIKYLENYHADEKEYAFTTKQACDCVDYWIASTDPIPMPAYLGEKDDVSLCFQRLSFNYSDEPGETLVLDELMSRCSNADAVKQIIGSLTVEESSRFQYLWMFGSGGEGKGSLGRGLATIFGNGCVTMAVPKTDSQKQFLTYSLQGKRLCIFPECNNYQFPQDALFKQWTGNDHVWFEAKGKMGRSGKINCKFIFFANEQPGVHGSDANLRRMIYSEISKPTVKYAATTYDALIAVEMPSFMIKCRRLYLEACPNGEDISFDDAKTKELIEVNEEQYEELTNQYLIPDAGKSITAAKMQEIKKKENLDTHSYRRWIAYLRSRLGVHCTVNRATRQRVWVGVRMRESYEDVLWNEQKNRTLDADNTVATP
jgi:phage/plasmid primase-like uncharacterized protein